MTVTMLGQSSPFTNVAYDEWLALGGRDPSITDAEIASSDPASWDRVMKGISDVIGLVRQGVGVATDIVVAKAEASQTTAERDAYATVFEKLAAGQSLDQILAGMQKTRSTVLQESMPMLLGAGAIVAAGIVFLVITGKKRRRR